MGNIASAKKRVLTNAKRTLRNKAVRSDLRTAVKKAEFALENKAEDRAELVRSAIKKLDSAVVKGVLHTNNAARKKSQLSRKLNQA